MLSFPPGTQASVPTGTNQRNSIGPDHVPTYSSEPDKPCETRSASICSTTTSLVSVVSRGTTTTSTSTTATCATILGCNVKDQSTGTAVSSSATASATYGPAIIYPKEPKDQMEIGVIRNKLDDLELIFLEIKSDALGFTAFFWISSIEKNDLDEFQQNFNEVALAYYYEDSRRGDYAPLQPPGDGLHPNLVDLGSHTINKRAKSSSDFWELSQVSTPNTTNWYLDGRARDIAVTSSGFLLVDYVYSYHESAGEGQYVYLLEEGIWDRHPEFQGRRIEHIHGQEYADDFLVVNQANVYHGSGVTSKIIGNKLGIANKTTAVILDLKTQKSAASDEEFVWEKILEALLNAADDIATKGRSGKSVVSMSIGFGVDSHIPQAFVDMFRKSCFIRCNPMCAGSDVCLVLAGKILLELDGLDTVLVAAAGNEAIDDVDKQRYPSRFLGESGSGLSNMIVVGATDGNCRKAWFSNAPPWVTTYAP